MALDYHNTMPPPNLNQNQPMNLIPTYTYPPFLGHVGGNDMSHMPDKIELWDHHDKHVSSTQSKFLDFFKKFKYFNCDI